MVFFVALVTLLLLIAYFFHTSGKADEREGARDIAAREYQASRISAVLIVVSVGSWLAGWPVNNELVNTLAWIAAFLLVYSCVQQALKQIRYYLSQLFPTRKKN